MKKSVINQNIINPLWIFAILIFLVLLLVGLWNGDFGLSPFEYGGLSAVLSIVLIKAASNFKDHGTFSATD